MHFKTPNLSQALLHMSLIIGSLEGVEIQRNRASADETPHAQNPTYQVIDVSKTGLNHLTLSTQESFKINAKGNILYATEPDTKMFPNDNDTNSIKEFTFKIPKIYFQELDTEALKKTILPFLNLNSKSTLPTPTIKDPLKGFSGECQNSTCVFSNDTQGKKLEKESLTAFGQGKDSYGINITADLVPPAPFTYAYKTINTLTFTSIGGEESYSLGARNQGIVNTNRLIAIGGKGEFATGFLNEYHTNASNLIAIGGQDKGVGFRNQSLLKANIITAVGGGKEFSYGLHNLRTIESNVLLALGGDTLNGAGVYNQGNLKTDFLILLKIQNKQIALINERSGKIQTKVLYIVGNGGYEPLRNSEGATLQAQDIYLRGIHALWNAGTISARNLFITDISSTNGGITLDSTQPSSLVFSIDKWQDTKPYLQINYASLTLNQDTSLQIHFSDKSTLASNLAYDKIYRLIAINGNGSIIDNRTDKTIHTSGLTQKPKTKVTQKEILFVFTQDPNKDPFPTNNKTKHTASPNTSLQEKENGREDFKAQIGALSPNALKIITSLQESHRSGGNFQQVALNEGLQNFQSNPALLQTLIQETDKTLEQKSTPVGIFSQKTIDYLNHQVTDRIQTLSFENKISSAAFRQWIRKYAMASNDDRAIIIPPTKDNNAYWAHIGGAYYQNSSASPLPSSTTSINISTGYDRTLDINENADILIGTLFNYAKNFYHQNNQKENFDVYALGSYTHLDTKNHELQWTLSIAQLLGSGKIHNPTIGILEEHYDNQNTALNSQILYKYKIKLGKSHTIKPLILGNYSFLYTPSVGSQTFFFDKSYDHIFALGAGGEWQLDFASSKHSFEFLGRYHIQDITQSRSIAFRGSQTFINYDLNPSRTWFRLGYSTKVRLTTALSLNLSVMGDVSIAADFLGTGNLGLRYIW
ncbi:hypothetical protein BKH46_04520 [Helicobacter sp. 12S02634-8]|uniref:autotransporter domain-containing protein n=1 Tax=Helicobacter sp. 12S02634-8 TaxID=1476199 RepID=UPI000BA56614|nr:autotransporter domain-containing protein [Helicobacter sp. 12S02634-8]PAF47351.1 hypothetical protein BKH46_04520 [Helicobacter sp. 12S02634-8]